MFAWICFWLDASQKGASLESAGFFFPKWDLILNKNFNLQMIKFLLFTNLKKMVWHFEELKKNHSRMLNTFWVIMSTVEKNHFQENTFNIWNTKMEYIYFFLFLKASMEHFHCIFNFLRLCHLWKNSWKSLIYLATENM